MDEKKSSTILEFLAIILILVIIIIGALMVDRFFFEGRFLSPAQYQRTNLYLLKKELHQTKLENLQLRQELKVTSYEVSKLRTQNLKLISEAGQTL